MTDYQLDHTDVDGRLLRTTLGMFIGGFAALCVWFLYLLVACPP